MHPVFLEHERCQEVGAEHGTRCHMERRRRLHDGFAVATREALTYRLDDLVRRHYLPAAPNLLKQEFVASAPNSVWLADITDIATGEGWLYLAAVLDLATRKIVDWSMRNHMRTELPMAALVMAAQQQRPAEGLICHPDRGSQYASEAYGKQIVALKAKPSMNRTAGCYDNAPVESFFHTLKVELARQRRWSTREDARRALFAYIEGYLTGGGPTPLPDTGPRNRSIDKWPKPVSTKAEHHHLRLTRSF